MSLVNNRGTQTMCGFALGFPLKTAKEEGPQVKVRRGWSQSDIGVAAIWIVSMVCHA